MESMYSMWHHELGGLIRIRTRFEFIFLVNVNNNNKIIVFLNRFVVSGDQFWKDFVENIWALEVLGLVQGCILSNFDSSVKIKF